MLTRTHGRGSVASDPDRTAAAALLLRALVACDVDVPVTADDVSIEAGASRLVAAALRGGMLLALRKGVVGSSWAGVDVLPT